FHVTGVQTCALPIYLLMVSTLLIIIPVFYVAKRYSLNPMLSIFLFFVLYIYLQSFNITRQSVAISVVFLSYIFLIERRHIWFCQIGRASCRERAYM